MLFGDTMGFVAWITDTIERMGKALANYSERRGSRFGDRIYARSERDVYFDRPSTFPLSLTDSIEERGSSFGDFFYDRG